MNNFPQGGPAVSDGYFFYYLNRMQTNNRCYIMTLYWLNNNTFPVIHLVVDAPAQINSRRPYFICDLAPYLKGFSQFYTLSSRIDNFKIHQNRVISIENWSVMITHRMKSNFELIMLFLIFVFDRNSSFSIEIHLLFQ